MTRVQAAGGPSGSQSTTDPRRQAGAGHGDCRSGSTPLQYVVPLGRNLRSFFRAPAMPLAAL